MGVLLVLAFILLQCAPGHRVVEKEEDVLKRRVHEYWNYRIRGQSDKSYSYEHPGYKEKVPLAQYIGQFSRSPVKWEAFEILEAWRTGEEGYVKFKGSYRYLAPDIRKGTFERTIEERWVKEDGTWFRLPQGF